MGGPRFGGSRLKQNTLFPPDFLERLKTLQVISRRILAGSGAGERTSPKRGRSVEFTDYRNYIHGDDPRYIDWNVYGRLERLFIKLFVEEEELSIYLLVDSSASMAMGTPPKLPLALKTAGALACIGLANHDRVGIFSFGGRPGMLAPLRGRQQLFRCLEFLDQVTAAGAGDLELAVRDFSRHRYRSGMVLVISDFLEPHDPTAALGRLLHNRHDLFCIQVLAPDEENPDLAGDFHLADVEDRGRVECTVTDLVRREYRRALETHCRRIEAFCRRGGYGYLKVSSSTRPEDLVLETFKQARLLQ